MGPAGTASLQPSWKPLGTEMGLEIALVVFEGWGAQQLGVGTGDREDKES